MSIALAATWDPRGELSRLARLMPRLRGWFAGAVVVLPPSTDGRLTSALEALALDRVIVASEWSQGRYLALKAAVELEATHVLYADLDRLIRWAELRPDELAATLKQLETVECLMIGRTEAAFATHPEALRQTEAIINMVFSELLGQPLDFSAGAKGFSRDAARFLIASTALKSGLGADTEWPALLHRAGYALTSVQVDGLDWETADRYREEPADPGLQRHAAAVYDADTGHWRYRADLARRIIAAGLDALRRPTQATDEEAGR